MRTGSDTRSKLIDNYEISNSPLPLRSAFMTGMEFGLFKDPNRLDSIVGFVSHILPLSQASTNSISRGDFFYAIINEESDTIYLKEDNYRSLLLDYPQDTLKLLMADFDGSTLISNDTKVDLVKKNYQYPPILLKKVFDLGVKKAPIFSTTQFQEICKYLDSIAIRLLLLIFIIRSNLIQSSLTYW